MAALQKKDATLARVLPKVGKDELLDSIQPIANFEGVPPTTAVTGGLCYFCYDPEGGPLFRQKRHLKCTRCKAVSYCSKGCQMKDWPRHKGICRVLNKFETSPLLKQIFVLQLVDAPFDTQEQLDAAVADFVHMQIDIGGQLLKRPLNAAECNLISLSPRCTFCGKSSSILRIEADMNQTPLKTLRGCAFCDSAWACCDEHWEMVKARHRFVPAPGGRGGLPECLLNREIQFDTTGNSHRTQQLGGRQEVWFPARQMKVYNVLKGSNWEKELGSHLQVPDLIRETTKRRFTLGLSMPYTIMWALENLHEGSTRWSLKQDLTIHVLGAYQYENAYSGAFEELLHRLPRLKKLKIHFIGPQMDELSTWGANGKETNEEVCPSCQRAQKKMFHATWGKTYHHLIQSRGGKFAAPDIAVAFNAALAYDRDRQNLWGPTVEYLVDNNITSLFTSYSEEDARSDIDVLQEAGAKIPEGLGPVPNEWQSLQYKKEPRRSGSYYSINNWVTGVFKGK